jgi:hypothetical protein
MKGAFFLIMVILMSACTRLDRHGVMVEVKEKLSSDDLLTFEEVGEVACRNAVYFVTKNHNRNLCIDHMRNEASNLGGTFIHVESSKHLQGVFSTGVEMKAKVYAPKEKSNN